MRTLTFEELGLPSDSKIARAFNARMLNSFNEYKENKTISKDKTFEIFILKHGNNEEYMLLKTTSLPFSNNRELYYSFDNAYKAYKLYNQISANLNNNFRENSDFLFRQNMEYGIQIDAIKEEDNNLYINSNT